MRQLIAVAATIGASLVFPGADDLSISATSPTPPFLTGLGPVFIVWVLAPAVTMCNTGLFYLGTQNYVFRSEDVFHKALWVCNQRSAETRGCFVTVPTAIRVLAACVLSAPLQHNDAAPVDFKGSLCLACMPACMPSALLLVIWLAQEPESVLQATYIIMGR